MGAAASIELNKPLDASDIEVTQNLEFAGNEVKRLRAALGHLAKLAGIDVVVYDASDILLGENDKEDFERCVKEISHIRKCLQLHTQSSRRQTRTYTANDAILINNKVDIISESKYHDSDSSESEDEK